MHCFDSVCNNLGVPIAHEKSEGPAQILTFLGLEIDTLQMFVRIPEAKLLDLRCQLVQLLKKKRVQLKELQSLTGLMNFCSRVISSSRAFIRRFYDAMIGISNPKHHIRLSASLKDDMDVWVSFLDHFNGICFIVEDDWLCNNALNLFTDSAGGIHGGCGCYYEGNWAYFGWPVHWRQSDIIHDITLLELIPIVLAFHIWAPRLANSKIVLRVDNMSLVYILNCKSSRNKRVMHLLRPLVLQAMIHNIRFKAVHVLGVDNKIADSISRQQWHRFRRVAAQASAEPEVVPQSFLEMISSLKLTSC